MTRTVDPLSAYQSALDCGDSAAVTALIAELLASGVDPIVVLTDVVASAQREVGRRWQRGQWTVAQERAATTMATHAAGLVAEHVANATPITEGTVLVACVEREWHALPAMIIDCALRSTGLRTIALGASTTLTRFNHDLLDTGPNAVAVSCSVLGSLPTARRFIESATAAGIPVIVGGPAFGPDDRRALALGATAWARDAHHAIDTMRTLPSVVAPAGALPDACAAEYAALAEARRTIVAALRERWSLVAAVATPDVDALHSVMDVADDAVHQVIDALGAALLTGDSRPLPDTASWVRELFVARGGDDTMISELGDVLITTLRDYPLTHTLLVEHFTSDD